MDEVKLRFLNYNITMKDLIEVLNTDLNLELTEVFTVSGAASLDLADYATEDSSFIGVYYQSNKSYYFVITDRNTLSYEI